MTNPVSIIVPGGLHTDIIGVGVAGIVAKGELSVRQFLGMILVIIGATTIVAL
ncbi:MAG: hypothetical protein WCL23_04050 [Candidatus Moraniibacteriota bacterium]